MFSDTVQSTPATDSNSSVEPEIQGAADGAEEQL